MKVELPYGEGTLAATLPARTQLIPNTDGPNVPEMYRRAATFVDKILTIPQSLLLRADEVIQ